MKSKYPFLDHVALEHGGDKHRPGGERSKETRKNENRRDRDRSQAAIHMPPVPWPFVMLGVEGIEPDMQGAAYPPFPVGETPVEDVAMKRVFDEWPRAHACRRPRQSGRSVLAKTESEDGQRVGRVDESDGIEAPAGHARLVRHIDATRP